MEEQNKTDAKSQMEIKWRAIQSSWKGRRERQFSEGGNPELNRSKRKSTACGGYRVSKETTQGRWRITKLIVQQEIKFQVRK